MSTIDFTDPQSQRQWVNVFLQGCYHDKNVLAGAMTSVTPAELMQVMSASVAQVIIYQALLSHWWEFKAMAAPQPLAIGIHTLVTGLGAYSEEQRGQVLQEASQIFLGSMSVPVDPQFTQPALAIIRHVNQKARVEPQLQAALDAGKESRNVDSVLKDVLTLKQSVRTAKVAVSPFDLSKQGNMGTLFSSGLAWLDGLIGGGFRSGEAYGIIAQTGGGKTSLTANMACALAAQGKKVMVIVTEQTFQEITLRAKYFAVVAQRSWEEFVPYDTIEAVPEDILPADIRASIGALSERILCYDSTQVFSMTDVRDLVMEHRPDVFFVDWAGTLADRIMEGDNNPWGTDRALCLRSIANETNAISKAGGGCGVVFHQLAPACGNNPFRDYDHTMAAECKSFCYNLSFAIILSPRDRNDIMKIACTKSRLGGRKDCIVRLNGPLSTFEPLTGYTKGRSGWSRKEAPPAGMMPEDKNKQGFG